MKRLAAVLITIIVWTCPGLVHARGLGSYGYHSNNYYRSYGTGSNPHSFRVRGYSRRNGTYVAPYHRTAPNRTRNDNYGTRGNYNPWTGKVGKR